MIGIDATCCRWGTDPETHFIGYISPNIQMCLIRRLLRSFIDKYSDRIKRHRWEKNIEKVKDNNCWEDWKDKRDDKPKADKVIVKKNKAV